MRPSYISEADHLAGLTEALNVIKLFLERGLNLVSKTETGQFSALLNSLKSAQPTLKTLIEGVRKPS